MLTLKVLNWKDFPPLAAITDARVVVQIKDQKRRPYNSGTFAVKDQLKAGGYKWQSVDLLWEKSFPKENFDMKSVRSEAWASSPDGVEVRVVDEAGIQVAAYRVDFGVWTGVPQLLGQPRHGEILSEPEDGASLAKRLRQPQRSNGRCR